jgi:hypothetical protein
MNSGTHVNDLSESPAPGGRARPPASAEPYRAERDACGSEHARELSRITQDIDDPVVKLKYLRTAIERRPPNAPKRLSDMRLFKWLPDLLPLAPLRRAWYRLRGLDTMHRVLLSDDRASPHLVEHTRAALLAARRSLGGAVIAVAVALPALWAGLVARGPDEAPTRDHPEGAAMASAAPAAPIADPPQSSQAAPIEPLAETLPNDGIGIMPSTIWLADKGSDWELYSNGLRIETQYAVRGKERRYVVHHRDQGAQVGVRAQPIGILFHTSESELWPLEESFQQDLRRSSTALLRYLQRAQSYNYLIDRFGRVYRVVDDDTRANHAGRGVWARDEEVYLDLNSAFLGVAFESRWDGGRTLPITRAQLVAGRNLTHYLRQKFSIAPEMCVTHGLTSVNPANQLIGYHRDWARGFPFEAFGLPNLYAYPTPSVALFGFDYDQEFLKAVGEPWPGLRAASEQLADEARSRSMSIADVRRERQARYRRWLQDLSADASVARESPAPSKIDTRG